MPEKNDNQNKPSLLTRILDFFMPDTYVNKPTVTPGEVSTYADLIQPLNSIPFFHHDLINCAKKLGYPAKDEGVCRGCTMRWIEAVITDSKDEFLKRAEKITQLSKLLDEGNTIEGLIQEEMLSPEELWDIKAFYESLLLYQYPHLSTEILGKPISQGDAEDIGTIASSDIMREQGGIKQTAPLYYGNFEKEDITSCLNALQEKVIETGYQKPVTFSLSLLGPKGEMHAVSMTFYPNEKTWQYMDVNSFPPKEPSNIEELITILPISSYQSFTLKCILPGHDFIKLHETLKIPTVTQNLIHAIDLLYLASAAGDLATVEQLLAMNVNPNTGKSEGVNPLYIAAQNGCAMVVDVLLDNGANPNQAGTNGQTPLFIAAHNGHVDVVRALLAKEGINPSQAMASGATPLYIAAGTGHIEVVRALLAKEGINPNEAKNDGVTPLYIAAQNGHVEVVRALLAQEGINPSQAMNDGVTPLCIAAQNGHVEVVRALLAHDGIELNKANTNGLTPLFIAAQNGHVEVVRALLAHDGIELNKANTNGLTPLFVAAKNGQIEVVRALLAKEGINPNQAMAGGATPLFIAAQNDHVEVVRALLAKEGINPNQAWITGETPLFVAAQNGCFEVVKALLKHENIDVSKVLQVYQGSLEDFARNKIPKDDALIERMDEYIARFKVLYPDKKWIEITPQEIAAIMGHQAVLELLSNPEQSPQHGVGAFRP